jgi:hypothetical protein
MTKPPRRQIDIVNGFDAWVETEGGTFSLSSQLYSPEVMHPDGARRIEQFKADPWPQWIYSLEDGTKIQFELFARNGASVTVLIWRLLTSKGKTILLFRPFLSGRDYHSCITRMAHQFGLRSRETYRGTPFGLPESSPFHGEYLHRCRRARGLDFTEDLAAPGVFRWDLARGEAACILATEGFENGLLTVKRSSGKAGGGSASRGASAAAEILLSSGSLGGRLPGQTRERQDYRRGLSLVYRLGTGHSLLPLSSCCHRAVR